MSFSDLMQSGKGPGLIGLLLALVVLGGFLVLGTFALDERFQGDGETLESKVRRQNLDLVNLKSRVETANGRLSMVKNLERIAMDLAKGKETLRLQEESLSVSAASNHQMREEISALELEFEAYKSRYRTAVREAAKGKNFPDLKLSNGETLHDVTIRQVNAIGMQVMHRDGVKRIPYDQLPPEMQEHYQFDPEEMKAAAKAEAMANQAQARAEAEAREAARLQAAEKEKAALAAEEVKKKHGISAIEARLRTLQNEIQALESAIRGEAHKTVSRAPIMREDLLRLEREKSELEARLRSLRATP